MTGFGKAIYVDGFMDGIERGEKQGGVRTLITTYQEFGVSIDDTMKAVMEKFSLEQKDAQQFMDQYWR